MLELLLVEELPTPVHSALLAFAHALPCERWRKYRELARLLQESFALDVDEIAWLVRHGKQSRAATRTLARAGRLRRIPAAREEKDRDFHSHR